MELDTRAELHRQLGIFTIISLKNQYEFDEEQYRKHQQWIADTIAENCLRILKQFNLDNNDISADMVYVIGTIMSLKLNETFEHILEVEYEGVPIIIQQLTKYVLENIEQIMESIPPFPTLTPKVSTQEF